MSARKSPDKMPAATPWWLPAFLSRDELYIVYGEYAVSVHKENHWGVRTPITLLMSGVPDNVQYCWMSSPSLLVFTTERSLILMILS